MQRRAVFIAALVAVAAPQACVSSGADVVDDVERTGETSSALTQSLRLPFPPGHTWYICQSYVGFSHKSNRPFDIGWTKTSCNAGNDDTGGKPVAAPGAGKISRLPNKVSGGDFMCLSLTGGGSIVFGHVKPAAGVTLGKTVAAGEVVAAVRAANDPDGQNAGIAHLHYEAFSGNDCYVGTAQAFTGAWRMQCAPDLPYNATYGFYNGTAIAACAPDAGASDGGAKEAGTDGRADTGADDGATAVAPPPTAEQTPSSMNAEPEPLPAAEDGCSLGRRAHDARASWAPTLVLALAFLSALARRRSPRGSGLREHDADGERARGGDEVANLRRGHSD